MKRASRGGGAALLFLGRRGGARRRVPDCDLDDLDLTDLATLLRCEATARSHVEKLRYRCAAANCYRLSAQSGQIPSAALI